MRQTPLAGASPLRRGWLYGVAAAAVGAALILAMSYFSKAHAQSMCMSEDDAEASFGKWHEELSGAGMGVQDNEAFGVYVKPDGSTFTIVRLILSAKVVCVVGVGKNWAQVPYVPHALVPRQKL